MVIKAHLLAAACAVLAVAAAVAQDDNLLVDPGFEDVGDDGWASGWDIWPDAVPDGASLTIDDQVVHEGDRSLRIMPGTREHEKIAEPPRGIGAGAVIYDGRLYYARGSHVWSFDLELE